MYSARRGLQAAMPVFRRGVGRSAFPRRGKASWRTRRVARRKRNVSDLPYAAPPLSCAAFFFKVQQQGQNWEQRKGGRCFSNQALNDRTARMSFDRKRSRMSSSMP